MTGAAGDKNRTKGGNELETGTTSADSLSPRYGFRPRISRLSAPTSASYLIDIKNDAD